MLNEKVINGSLKVGSTGQFTIDTSGNIATSGTLTTTSSSQSSFSGTVSTPVLSINGTSSEALLTTGIQNVGGTTVLWYASSGLEFKTGSTGSGGNRIKIDSSGNLLLRAGTFSMGDPTVLFSINSSGNITKINNVATSWPGSQGGANTFLKNDGSGNLSWSAGASGATGSGATGQATFWSGSTTLSGDNAFWWDNTNKRLGIGTNAPLTLTHIVKAAAPSSVTKANTYLHLGGAEFGGSSFRGLSAGYLTSGTTHVPAYLAFLETSSGGNTFGDWVFATRSNGSDVAPTERMRVRGTGQTLIKQGQFGSQASFANSNVPFIHAASSSAPSTLAVANSYIHMGGSEFATSSFRSLSAGFLDGGITNPPAIIAFQEINQSGNTYGDWVFYTRNVTSDTLPTERLRIDNSGIVTVNSGGTIRITGSSTGYFGLKAAASTTSRDYTLPAADGTSGQTLTTDGSGTMTWATAFDPVSDPFAAALR